MLPYVIAHMLLDHTCPISSHTPSEVPKQNEETNGAVLPQCMASPCGVCADGIRMGEMKRTLPCGHYFHARCIDNVCVVESFWKEEERGGTVVCPECELVIFPTPELMDEYLATSVCSSDSRISTLQ